MAYQPKSYRKFLAGSVSAALVATAVGPVVASAASFSDVNPSDPHAANISALVEKGYIKGFADGTFKPYQNVTRGQVAKIFARILKDNGAQVPADKNAFSDVPVDSQDQELVEAAALVKAQGVMTGSNGKLNPAANMTREQMAKVLVEAFKLTLPAGFTSKITDLDKADASFRNYIQILEANGVTTVTEFKPKDAVSRAAFASFVKRAMDASGVVTAANIQSVKFVDQNTLEVTFSGELKEVKKEDFAIQGVDIDSVSIKAAAAAETKTTVVVIKTKTALQEGKSYNVSYKGQTTDKAKVDVPVVTPKVESVSAINAKQVKVTFNVALNKDSAEDIANYAVYNAADLSTNLLSVTGTQAASAKLLEDGKTVLITLASDNSLSTTDRFANSTNLKVVVKADLKSAGGKTLGTDYTNTAVAVTDNTVPVVSKVEVLGSKSLKVVFSEPVEDSNGSGTNLNVATSEFLVDNGSVAVASAVASPKENAVYLTLGTDLAAGDHKVTVNPSGNNYIKDFAGYTVLKSDTTFTYTKDTNAPTVTVESATPTSVKIKFSKPVKNLDLSGTLIRHTYDNSTYELAGNVAATPTNLANGYSDTWTLNFSSKPLPAGNAVIYIKNSTVAGQEIVDSFGNKTGDLTLNVTVNADTTAPTATVTTAIDTNDSNKSVFTVVYSEDVNNANTLSNYVLKDKDGNEVPLVISNAYSSTNYTVKLKSTTALNGGQYTLLIKNIEDKAPVANKMPATTYTLNVADASPTTVTAKYNDGATTDKVTLVFSKDMDTTTLAQKANYQVLYNGTNAATITDVKVVDSRTVVLTTDNQTYSSPKVNLSGNLKTAAGSTILASGELVKTVNAFADTVGFANFAGTNYSAKAVDTDTIAVKFDTAIDPTQITVSGFHVDNDSTNTNDLDGASVVSITKDTDGNSIVTLKLNGALSTAATYNGGTTKVYLDAGAVKTYSGAANSASAFSSGVSITDKIAPTVVSKVVSADGTKLVLTFSEALDATTISNGSTATNGFTVSGATLTNANYVTVDGVANTIILTGSGFSTATQVSYNKDLGGITDANGVVLPSLSGVTATTADGSVNAIAAGDFTIGGTGSDAITAKTAGLTFAEGVKVYYYVSSDANNATTPTDVPSNTTVGTQATTNIGSGFVTSIAGSTAVTGNTLNGTKAVYVRLVDEFGNKSNWVKIN